MASRWIDVLSLFSAPCIEVVDGDVRTTIAATWMHNTA
jgi:hypothetical protein